MYFSHLILKKNELRIDKVEFFFPLKEIAYCLNWNKK